jgi:hypothetical protein
MANTIFDASMSLDGFMTASHQTPRSRWAAGACACTNGRSAATRPTTGGRQRLWRTDEENEAIAVALRTAPDL